MMENVYGTVPKWIWNAPLENISAEEIDFQFRGFSEHDKNSGVMIVLWKHEGYLSEEFFTKIGYALKSAEKYGLCIMLWDENGFPSGGCGGILEREYPEHCAKILNRVEYSVKSGETLKIEIPAENFTGAVSVIDSSGECDDLKYYIKNDFLEYSPEQDCRVMIFTCDAADSTFMCFHGSNLVDYLDKKAVEKFIDITHEQYYKRFGNYFGSVIKYAFYDEPSFYHIEGGRIWTKRYNELFEKKYGFSPVTLYPAMFGDAGENTAWARNMMFSFRAELYADSYVKTLAEWCASKGITLTGHMDQEEIINPVPISGDLMKVFKYQPIPGVDEIASYGRGSAAYKLISSAAENYGKSRVMCEVFGAMGEEIDVNVLLKEGIDMLCKGINFFVPHGTWYDTAPDKVIFPPELSFRSEKFAELIKTFNEYVEAHSKLLAGKKLCADIGILYPIHDLQAQFWFNGENPYHGCVNPEYSDYMMVGELLALQLRHDFIFLHPETLDGCTVENGIIRLDNGGYKIDIGMLIIPGMEYISKSNLEKVLAFEADGGKVIMTSKRPSAAIDFENGVVVKTGCSVDGFTFVEKPDSENLRRAVETGDYLHDVYISTDSDISGGNLSYIHKKDGDKDIYFIGNSSDCPVNAKISVKGNRALKTFDPVNNSCNEISYTISSGYTTAELYLKPVSSIVCQTDTLL